MLGHRATKLLELQQELDEERMGCEIQFTNKQAQVHQLIQWRKQSL